MPEINSLVVTKYMETYICGRVQGYSQTLRGNPLVLFTTNEGFRFVSKPEELEVVDVTKTKKEAVDVEQMYDRPESGASVLHPAHDNEPQGDFREDGAKSGVHSFN